MSNHIPDDLSIPPFLNRTSASDDEALPKIRVETYDKINYWRDKLDQTAKLNKPTRLRAPPSICFSKRNTSAISVRFRQ
jgi:hypothetical protein